MSNIENPIKKGTGKAKTDIEGTGHWVRVEGPGGVIHSFETEEEARNFKKELREEM